MLEKLNERLEKVKNQQQKKQKWENQLADYQKELIEKQRITTELKAKLQDENEDVDKLNGLSLTNLFSTITGSKDDRMREEKKEAAAAQLKYDEALNATIHIEAAIEQFHENLNALPDVDREYQNILTEKEELIKDTHSPLTEELYALSEQIANLQFYLTESGEAIQAGKEVLDSLTDAIDSLNSAEGWGTFDMIGGGMISTAVKHNHIDDAKESIHFTQSKMRVFQKELLDINQESEWCIDISGLLTFADYFFDGIITDWFVQGKIKRSLEQTERQKEKVEQIVFRLRDRSAAKQDELVAVENKRQSMLERS